MSAPEPFRRVIRCSVCGQTVSSVALERNEQEGSGWRFLFAGLMGHNGERGDSVSVAEAARLSKAFGEPLTYRKVHTTGLYDEAGYCRKCKVPYCVTHWSISATGFGTCPEGHGQSLDPHWHP